MDTFIKAAGGVLIALIFYLVLSKQGKDVSLLLTIAVCCMVAAAAVRYLGPVVTFFEKLQALSRLDNSLLKIILRSAGIGLLSEIVCLICTDAGNAALGKTLQLLACAVVLWMSIPIFTSLITLVEEILISV